MVSAVIGETEHGWLVDHQSHFNQCYTQCRLMEPTNTRTESIASFFCVPDLFAIHSPFMMDSQFEAQLRKQHDDTAAKKPPKKRKRKQELNEGEMAAMEYHNKIGKSLKIASGQLVALGKEKGYFKLSTELVLDNNIVARKASQIQGAGDSLAEMSSMALNAGLADPNPQIELEHCRDMFNTLVRHSGDMATEVELLGARYLIPPQSSFLMSDITFSQPLLQGIHQYDLIVIDPPWVNKSVKRKKKYHTLKDEDLKTIPLPRLARPNALIVVWVTNKQCQSQFVLEELFPSWNVTPCSTWHWLKVTTSGDPVCSMDGLHSKKPYESVILGRYSATSDSCLIPDCMTIASVPCAIHSRKPPLRDILQSFLPDNPYCLEVFARNLLPGWTSWGNEVLKYQHADFFVKSDL